MENWHALQIEEIVKTLNTNLAEGLTKKEVKIRQEKFGFNKLPEEKPLSKLRMFLEQFRNPLIYVLIIAGIISLSLRKITDALVIFGLMILNTLVGFFQENKASQALRELKKVIKIEAEVIREGNKTMVNAAELVPGDIVILSPGNKVPADGRLIENYHLKINEAPLTGEWLPAEKNIEILPEETPVADRDNMVYMGSIVEDGKGKVLITAIGQNTEMGKVAIMVKEAKEEKTPLQKKIAKFSRIIGVIVVFLCLSIFIGGIIRERPFFEMLTTAVAVAVAAVPWALPVAMTVILALGMERILKRKGLVRKLVAVETLGGTSIACTDKTLTLTEGKMEMSESVTSRTEISGQEKKWPEIFQEKKDEEQILLLTITTLCNEAFIENPQDSYPLWRLRGRPTDQAMVLAGAQVGLKKSDLEKKYPELDEIPFKSENKYFAALHRVEGENILYVVGAPEKIFELSSHFQEEGKLLKITETSLLKLNQILGKLTAKGLRVLAITFKKTNQSSIDQELIKNLIFIGFIGLKDPLRKEAKKAIAICKKAGIKPILVTGDHLLTAKAVAKEISLSTKEENIIEGKDLDELSDEEFQKRIKNIEIYARAEPRHKLKIIQAWQKRGEVVGMTGDGINDAPALKQADIGIALGSGTDVAKEVSDLVLLTDNFSIIPAAVEEGRGIVDNLRKIITYQLSYSFVEIILIGMSVIFGWPLPITALQILWVNLVQDGPPGVALAFEEKEKEIMKRKPEEKDIPLLSREMKSLIFIIGIFTNLFLLTIFLWLLGKFGPDHLSYIQTMVFLCLGISSLFFVFSCRSLRKNIWQINPLTNKFLLGAMGFGFLMLISAIYFPPFQALLKTASLEFQDWLIVLGLGVINLVLIETTKWYFIKSKNPR